MRMRLLGGIDFRTKFLKAHCRLDVVAQDCLADFDIAAQKRIFGLDRLDPAQFDLTMRLTGVTDFAAAHPRGFAMNVGPCGERLSGGERQSVALERKQGSKNRGRTP
jgi:ATP-binding cassette subfamily C protein LapB